MSDKDEHPESPFDEVMKSVGTSGLFQRRFSWVYNFFLVLITSWIYLNKMLVLAVPDHWCYVPGRENTNYTLEEWKNLTLPLDVDVKGHVTPSKCKMYNISMDELLSNAKEKYDEIGCQFGWEYDRTWYTETAPSQEDWVCERELYVSNAFALGRIGDVIGTLIFGQLGDMIGRRPIFYVTIVVIVLARCLTAYTAHSFYLFIFFAFVGQMVSTGVSQSPLIVSMEISDEDERAHITMLQFMGWTTGLSILPFIFWMLGHWVPFMLVTTLPTAVFIFISFKILIESPRWLANQGKTAKCIRQLEIIAKVNKTKVPDDAMITLRKKEGKQEKYYGILSLFSNWRLAKNSILLIFCWINGSICYFILMLNIDSLGGNPFLNFFAQSIAELPANVLGRVTSDKFGRRWSQIFGFTLGGIAGIPLAVFIIDNNRAGLVSALAAFIKFCIAYAYYATWLETLELYPTSVRQTGLSFGYISTSASGILSPYIVYLGTAYNARYPYLVIIFLMFMGSVCAFFLPETLYEKLPDTLADAQKFGAEQKYFRIPKKPKKT